MINQLKKEFKQILKNPNLKTDENATAINEFLFLADKLMNDAPAQIEKRLSFLDSNSEKVELLLSKKPKDYKKIEKLTVKTGFPERWLKALLDSLQVLNEDNRNLSFALMKAENILHEKWLSRLVNNLPEPKVLPVKESHMFETYEEEIKQNLEKNQEDFGQDILCFTTELAEILEKIKKSARSTQIVIFQGETGTGKTTFAHALHFRRDGGKMMELSCLENSVEDISKAIQKFLKTVGDSKPGLLIRNIDSLKSEEYKVLTPILKNFKKKAYIYLTCEDDIFDTSSTIPTEILYRLKQLIIKTVPIRKRSNDLLYQIFWNLDKYAKEMDVNFIQVDKVAIEESLKYAWPGNSLEVNNIVQAAIIENKAPLINKFNFPIIYEDDTKAKSVSLLSPLEEGEKQVIQEYLRKNSYNKSRTMRDLEITINTLNAKMQRYGIRDIKRERKLEK